MPAGARAGPSGDPYAAVATANTLNYALGRRHVKSWMTSASPAAAARSPNSMPIPAPAPPVRKRGRPRKHRSPESFDQEHATRFARSPVPFDQQHATLFARPPGAPSAENLPSSNSTSPQLANVVTNRERNASHGDAHVAVFPSPAPSEEDVPSGDSHETAMGQTVNANHSTSLQSSSAFRLPQAAVSKDPVGQPVLSPKRWAGERQVHVAKRPRVDFQSQPLQAATGRSPDRTLFSESLLPPTALPMQHESISVDHAPSHSHRGHSSNQQPALSQFVQDTQHENHPQSRRNDTSLVHGQTLRGQSVRGQPLGIPPNAQQHTSPRLILAPQRQESHLDGWYSVDLCMGKLNHFKATYPSQSNRDKQRLHLLEEAVRRQDWAYLTLHQQYCVMACQIQLLPMEVQRNSNLYVAFALMQHILDDNLRLGEPFLRFFCVFPFAITDLRCKWPTKQQELEHDFVAFVNYSPNGTILRQLCEKRRIPPTPREMADCAIKSSMFQRLLFTSVLHSLIRPYPHSPALGILENQLLQVFDRAQMTFELQKSLGQLGGRQQADEELRVWTIEIDQLILSMGISPQRQSLRPTDAAFFHQLHPPPLPQQQHQQRPQRQQHQQRPQRQQQHQPRPQPPQVPQSFSQAYNLPYNHHTPGDMTTSYHHQQQPPPVVPPRTVSHVYLSPRARQGFTALLPRPGVMQPQQRVPNPARFALHQAHLQSPLLQALDRSSTYYYFWRGFSLKPSRVMNANNVVEKLSFAIAKERLELFAKALAFAPGAIDRRAFEKNHQTLRLRCVKWTANKEPEATAWAVAENSWIPHSFFTFNQTSLQLRKKLHHGKDLPVDLTGLIREGPNVLEVSVMSDASDTTHRGYLIAVEFLGFMTQADIKALCYEKKIPAEKMIEEFKRRLSSTVTDDDDLVVVETMLTINLRDPFSASKICETPVRGTACLHNECFDLDTFLTTRPRKGDVSVADQWRCPICRLDARPTVLVVDEFLVQVRKELESQGLLDTRAIVVDQDGSWKPKPEERDPNGIRDSETPEPHPAAAANAARPHPPPPHEIIDLDSD
ncbi:MIZ/SP-RING zinc finger [Stagonosporopsis vannaccii]|nr:MIZ/SP-RING zinc finger [Stagonosporopsis vannaccii]